MENGIMEWIVAILCDKKAALKQKCRQTMISRAKTRFYDVVQDLFVCHMHSYTSTRRSEVHPGPLCKVLERLGQDLATPIHIKTIFSPQG